MTVLIAICLVLAILWLLGWVGNILLGLTLFIVCAFVDLWDRIFPPGPPSNP